LTREGASALYYLEVASAFSLVPALARALTFSCCIVARARRRAADLLRAHRRFMR